MCFLSHVSQIQCATSECDLEMRPQNAPRNATTCRSNIGVPHRRSVSAFRIGVQYRRSASAFRIGVQYRRSVSALRIGVQTLFEIVFGPDFKQL